MAPLFPRFRDPAAVEVNFDGLVGPTHHYAGLGVGNLASQRHRHEASNPRGAALEGLAKMRLLNNLGIPQGVLPPQERPLVGALRALGFDGEDHVVLGTALRQAPDLLASCASTSSMWAANAATVSPAADTVDRRVHVTPANLVSQFHRSLEAPATTAVLRTIFHDRARFIVHDPLPAAADLADEGAANHMRLAPHHGHPGIEIFVYGRDRDAGAVGCRFPARQTLAACEAVARRHGLDPARVVFLRQSAEALDAGVFHNDVIAVANENVLLVHEQAYEKGTEAIAAIRSCYEVACGGSPVIIEVPAAEVPLDTAVDTYLFNSQLVTLPGGGMALICPIECHENTITRQWLDRLVAAENPVVAVHPAAVRQSMKNGGGPACLRLRVVLAPTDHVAIHQGVLVTPELLGDLEASVNRHYRDRIVLEDLADPSLLAECRNAIAELKGILGLRMQT